MAGQSIGITGDGPLFDMWLTNGQQHFPRVTFYDRSAKVTAFRRAEADLGRRGLLDKQGTEMAKRIAEDLANPPEMTVMVALTGPIDNGEVTVTCRNGNKRKFKVRLTDITDKALDQGFFQVNAAIARCLSAPVKNA